MIAKRVWPRPVGKQLRRWILRQTTVSWWKKGEERNERGKKRKRNKEKEKKGKHVDGLQLISLFFLHSSFFPGNDVGLLHENVFRKENLPTINVGKTKTLKENTAEGLVALVQQLTSVHAKTTVSVYLCSSFPILWPLMLFHLWYIETDWPMSNLFGSFFQKYF